MSSKSLRIVPTSINLLKNLQSFTLVPIPNEEEILDRVSEAMDVDPEKEEPEAAVAQPSGLDILATAAVAQPAGRLAHLVGVAAKARLEEEEPRKRTAPKPRKPSKLSKPKYGKPSKPKYRKPSKNELRKIAAAKRREAKNKEINEKRRASDVAVDPKLFEVQIELEKLAKKLKTKPEILIYLADQNEMHPIELAHIAIERKVDPIQYFSIRA